MRFAPFVVAVFLCQPRTTDGNWWRRQWTNADFRWSWDKTERYFEKLAEYVGDPAEWIIVMAIDYVLLVLLLLLLFVPMAVKMIGAPSIMRSSKRFQRRVHRPPRAATAKRTAPVFNIEGTSDTAGCLTKYACVLSETTTSQDSFLAFLRYYGFINVYCGR